MKKRRGRPRRRENAWMPEGVEVDQWGFVFRNKATREYHRLAGPDASKAEVWTAYEAVGQAAGGLLDDVIDAYLRSPQFAERKPATQRDYRQYSVRIRRVFGQVVPDQITSPMVQLFMDARGEAHPVAANHEKAFLSVVMNWGKARGHVQISNPCDPVKNFNRKPGGRYVEHDELFAFYDFLLARGHRGHAAAMMISYCCGSRQQDVLRLLRRKPAQPAESDCYLVNDGLVIWQAKTGKVQLKEWNNDLRAAVELATSVQPKVAGQYVISSRNGQPYTRGGFNSSWQRAQVAALAAGVLLQRFRFHDLKVKALSDFRGGDRVEFSGHKSRSQAERYNRTPDRVASLPLPKR